MSKYDLIYYWQNYLDNQDDKEIKPNDYILKFSLENSYSRDFFCNWYSFKNYQELLGFIRFVVIPSTYITRVFGKEENTIFLDALEEYETIELIEESDCNMKNSILEEIKYDYEILEILSKNFTIDRMKQYINISNSRGNVSFGILENLEFFENAKMIGKELVQEYESDNMLEELESHMDLKKSQIIALFDGIDKNPFMMKRLGTYLSNTLAF